MKLHVGIHRCHFDLDDLYGACSARDIDKRQRVAKHVDLNLAVCGPAELVGFEGDG